MDTANKMRKSKKCPCEEDNNKKDVRSGVMLNALPPRNG